MAKCDQYSSLFLKMPKLHHSCGNPVQTICQGAIPKSINILWDVEFYNSTGWALKSEYLFTLKGLCLLHHICFLPSSYSRCIVGTLTTRATPTTRGWRRWPSTSMMTRATASANSCFTPAMMPQLSSGTTLDPTSSSMLATSLSSRRSHRD